jgi:cytoskeletal protein RodZ
MVVKQQTPTQQTPGQEAPTTSENRKKPRELVNSVLVAAVVSALVAGLVSFLITQHHDQAVAGQAKAAQKAQTARQYAGQQAQAAGQLEKAANGLYQATAKVYTYQVKCAGEGNTWPVCAALSPSTAGFSATTATFDTDNFGLGDPAATALTAQFAKMSIGTVEASSPAAAQQLWTNTVSAYLALIKRCGQLVRG